MANEKEKRGESFLPVPYNQKDISALPDGNLTPTQLKQLYNVTRRFLADGGKKPSMVNILEVKFIVRTLVEEGLKDLKNISIVDQSDNLETAFSIAYGRRKNIINQTKFQLNKFNYPQIEKEGEKKENYGPFALKGDMIAKAQNEVQDSLKTVYFFDSQKFLLETEKRNKIFNQLFNRVLNQVEKMMPGASKVELEDSQKVGLVRNYFFSLISMDDVTPLLETEDFITNKTNFEQNTNSPRTKDRIYALQNEAKIDRFDSFDFFKDLTAQIDQFIQTLPPKQTSLESVEYSFRKLNQNFLVSHPFTKLPEISELEQTDTASIWDEDKVLHLRLENKLYTLPTSQTLNYASLRRRSDNMKRSRELDEGKKIIEELELMATNSPYLEEIKKIETENQKVTEHISMIENQFYQGIIRKTDSGKKKDFKGAIDGQLATIAQERDFYSLVTKYSEEHHKQLLFYLGKYDQGQPIEATDIENFKKLYYATSTITYLMNAFIRFRVRDRFDNIEKVYFSNDLEKAAFLRVNYLSLPRFYQQAIDTTVVDLLNFRSKRWLEDYRGEYGELSEEKAALFWRVEATMKETELRSQLYPIANRHVNREYDFDEKRQSRARLVSHLVDNELTDPGVLLTEVNDPLKIQIEALINLKKQIESNDIPSIKILNASLVKKLRDYRQELIHLGITSLSSPETSYFQTLAQKLNYPRNKRLDQKNISNLIPAEEGIMFTEKIHERYGPIEALLHAYVKLPPKSLWLQQNPTLKELVHREKIHLRTAVVRAFPHRAEELANTNLYLKTALIKELSEYGFPFIDVIEHSLNSDNLAGFRDASIISNWFFSIEKELYDWGTRMEEKLEEQMKNLPLMLSKSPNKIVDGFYQTIKVNKRKIASLRKSHNTKINSLMNKLEELRLIKVSEVNEQF